VRAIPYAEPFRHENFPVSLQLTDAPGAPLPHSGKTRDHNPSALRIAFDLKAPPACFPLRQPALRSTSRTRAATKLVSANHPYHRGLCCASGRERRRAARASGLSTM
jgi:hypothetical protein